MNPPAERRAARFGQAMAGWREGASASVAEAARRIGITPAWLHAVEAGRWDPHALSPALATLVASRTGLTAAALGFEMDEVAEAPRDDPPARAAGGSGGGGGAAGGGAAGGALAGGPLPAVSLARVGGEWTVMIAMAAPSAALPVAQAALLIHELAKHVALAVAR